VAALLVEPSLLQPLKQTGEEVLCFLVVVEVHFLFYLRFISLTFNTYSAPKRREKRKRRRGWDWGHNKSSQARNGPVNVLLLPMPTPPYWSREQAADFPFTSLELRFEKISRKLRLLLRQNMYLGCEGTHFPSHSQTFSRLFYGLIAFFLFFRFIIRVSTD
jgi:hypothetical protein